MSRKIGVNRWALAAPTVVGLAHGLFFSVDAFPQTCDPSLTTSIHTVEHIVDSLPLDGADPSAIAPGINVRWMHGQLDLIREACSRGNDVEAVWRLEQVQSRMTLELKLYLRTGDRTMSGNTKSRLAAAGLLATGLIAAAASMADEPATADAVGKLKSGLSQTVQLLQLMDTDKNGKVSKEEFMRFMEAEFDFADKNKDGELDPKELRHLQYRLSHPVKGPGR